MGDGWIFLKNLSALLFNDDLSNEPNFDCTVNVDFIRFKYVVLAKY
jgi:hypothetical protein